jgi:hypothetical protein
VVFALIMLGGFVGERGRSQKSSEQAVCGRGVQAAGRNQLCET